MAPAGSLRLRWVHKCRRAGEGRAAVSRVDLAYKVKTDDQRRESCGPVKHFHASYWAMPLSLFALSYAFLVASVSGYRGSLAPFRIDIPILVPRILALLALVVWVVFAVLQVRLPPYQDVCRVAALWTCAPCDTERESPQHATKRTLQMVRLGVFPRKVCKEFADPARGPAFLFATMSLLVLAAGIMADVPDSEGWARVAKALFWLAAPAQLAASMLAVAHWLLYLREWEHLSPLWLAVPLANVFGALAWAAVYRKGAGEGAPPPALTPTPLPALLCGLHA